MQILAPIVLNALGEINLQANAGGINVNTITSVLSSFVGNHQQQAPEQQSIISKLIDRNNDGNIADDVVGIIGKFFK